MMESCKSSRFIGCAFRFTICYSQNEVQTHINKDNGAEIPLFIQYDRKFMS